MNLRALDVSPQSISSRVSRPSANLSYLAESNGSDESKPRCCPALVQCWPVLIIGLCLVGASFAVDAFADHWFATHAVKVWKVIAQWVSRCADWPGLMIAAVVALLGAWLLRKHRTKQLLFAMIMAAAVAGLAANAVRAGTGRTRPSAGKVQGWHVAGVDGSWVGINYKRNSFPSAHTTTAMGFVAPLLLLAAWRRRYRWLLVPAIAVPLLVGWSRLYQSAHHFSDVAAGLLLGLICGLCVCRAGPWWAVYRQGPEQ